MSDSQQWCSKLNIWVTGAGSGIGAALVRLLVEEGHYVIISGRRREPLLTLQKAAPKRIRVLACDVGQDDSIAEAGATLREITDQLDMVIACAGTCEYDDGLTLDIKSYRRVFDANFFGVVNTLRESLPLLSNSREPVFVAVSSLSSVVGFPRAEAYGASKAAVDYFMQALRADTANVCLRTVLVRPGFIDTPLTQENDFDMPFLMTAEQAAKRILIGLKGNASVIDFPKRLSWPLRLLGTLSPIWFNLIAPRMTRIRTLRKV
ncbi:SDR family NAD(P)-dependent oxidoreductase [Microbulbifer agarilyticus]